MNHIAPSRIARIALALACAAATAASADETKDSPAPTIESATKGLKGKGPLSARIEVESGDAATGIRGAFTCALFDDKAPVTVANFVALARGQRPWKDANGKWVKKPLYDGLLFHRVIPEFMIQGGDPEGTGRGGPGFAFDDEIKQDLVFDKGGLMAMANKGPNTNGSQFFITEKAAPFLNGRYSVFGLCDSLELEQKIARLPVGQANRPISDVKIKKITISRGEPAKTAKAAR